MIYIVPDTNILNISYGKNARYDTFYMNKSFEEIVSSIAREKFRDDVDFLIPQIVMDELYVHKLEAYQKEKKELDRLAKNMWPLVSLKCQFGDLKEYELFLKEKVEHFRTSHGGFSVLPVCSERFFYNIVEKAIKKEAPFEGKEKSSDKGFKDAVIFFSMVDYAQKNGGEFYYLTRDDKFYGEDGKLLCRQFKELTGSVLKVFREYKEVKTEILMPSVKAYIDHLEYEISEKTIFLRKSVDEIKTTYCYAKPEFEAMEIALQRIRNDIDRIYDEDLRAWEKEDLRRYDDETQMEYYGSIEVNEKYNQNGIWSVVFVHSSYLGGAHGGSWYTSRVYDLNTGNVLFLTELIEKPEDEILQMIREGCKKDKELRHEEALYFDEFEVSYQTIEEVKFFLGKEGIYIYFDEYEAGCYASGMIDFLLVPMEEIKRIRRSDLSESLKEKLTHEKSLEDSIL